MGLFKALTGHYSSELLNPPYCGDGHTTEMYERMDENARNYSSDRSSESSD